MEAKEIQKKIDTINLKFAIGLSNIEEEVNFLSSKMPLLWMNLLEDLKVMDEELGTNYQAKMRFVLQNEELVTRFFINENLGVINHVQEIVEYIKRHIVDTEHFTENTEINFENKVRTRTYQLRSYIKIKEKMTLNQAS